MLPRSSSQADLAMLFCISSVPGTQNFSGGASGKVQKSRVLSLGQEDPLEEGMATHSGILACKTPWTEESGGLWSTQLQNLT